MHARIADDRGHADLHLDGERNGAGQRRYTAQGVRREQLPGADTAGNRDDGLTESRGLDAGASSLGSSR